MESKLTPSLGVLALDQGPRDPARENEVGSIQNPASIDFPTITEVPEGSFGERVLRGDPALEPSYIAAARRLVEQGAVAISSNCGFTIRLQGAVASSVQVPVAMSSMLLLPMLLKQLPAPAKIAVLTYDSNYVSEDMIGLSDPQDRARVVVGGIEGSQFWHDELKMPAPPFDVVGLEKVVSERVMKLREEHPEIAAILFECAVFPAVSPAIRRLTNLPVYDLTLLCRMMLAAIGK
ncbi:MULTISPECIES: hypothetical protein [Mesorhizobium]|uniref:hypothetical protein n=1 Tax=Mesorhizobium TaxID=68287 RepID=UPI00047BE912|nr:MULTISPECIES: hypothetical protein [Mesorhizobium]BCG82902.1 hypothetical protein MesoLj113b_64440 [Mesorhizobium sp. 113-3-3]BCG90779.1 hypothetical protein MesoLj113c_68890 [Mesorhizobium sp. 113-3-9]